MDQNAVQDDHSGGGMMDEKIIIIPEYDIVITFQVYEYEFDEKDIKADYESLNDTINSSPLADRPDSG